MAVPAAEIKLQPAMPAENKNAEADIEAKITDYDLHSGQGQIEGALYEHTKPAKSVKDKPPKWFQKLVYKIKTHQLIEIHF